VFANTSIEVSKDNLYRMKNIMFPPEPEILSKICQQGFDDARRFLQQNDLICCDQCISSDNTSSCTDNTSINRCYECETQKQMVLGDSLPETVVLLLENAINNYNDSMKRGLLSVMTLPYDLTVDVAYAAYLKFADNLPKFGANLISIGDATLTYMLSSLFDTLKRQTHSYTKVTCQLAVNEFSNENELLTGLHGEEMNSSTVRNQLNIDFSLNVETNSEAYTEYFFSNGSRKNIYDEADRPSILFDNESDSPQKTIGHVLAFT